MESGDQMTLAAPQLQLHTVSGLISEYLPGFMIFSYLISEETTAKNGKGVYNKSKIGEK